MADYSTAETSVQTALNAAAEGGLIEQYASSEGNSARLGKGVDQIKALTKLEGLAHRRSNGGFINIGRLVDPFC